MKWVFLAGLFLITPLLIVFLQQDRKRLPVALFILGLLPFIEQKFNISASPIAWPMWPGHVRGIEISATDALALAIILAGRRMRIPLSLVIAFSFLIFAYLLSTLASGFAMASTFYGWQLLRVALVFFAVVRACSAVDSAPLNLLSGLIAGLAIQAVVALYEFGTGTLQSGGWFSHQNLLGMATHFIVYPAFAAFLGGYYKKRMAVAIVSAFVIAFAGGSRATIGLMVVGMMLTALLSSMHRPTARKTGLIFAAVVGMLAVSPLLYAAVSRRSEAAFASSNEERERMELAAGMIFADHPMGTGANRYVVTTNVGGYSARAGVAWNMSNRAAPVHNVYYLAAAEMGWVGLAAVLWFFAAIIRLGFVTLRKAKGFGGEYAAGSAAALVIVAVHCYFEWIFMLQTIHVLLAMTLGVVAAQRTSSEARSTATRPQAAGSDPQNRIVATVG